MKIIKLIFLICLAPLVLFGQNSNIRFYNIGTDEGLSHSMVTSITEDSIGFMWFATQEGLNRYDGYTIKVYKAGSDDNTISKNFITDITVDSYNQLWIYYTGGGISRFDQVNEVFHHYNSDSTKDGSISSTYFRDYSNRLRSVFFEDSDKNMWISTNKGVNRYIRETDSFEAIIHDPADTNSLSDNRVTHISEGIDKTLWIGTLNGLNRYNPHTKKNVRFMADTKGQGLNDTHITVTKTLADSSVWVGTNLGGLNVIENGYNTNTKVTYLINKSTNSFLDPSVLNIHTIKKGVVYVSSREGVYRVVKQHSSYTIKLVDESREENMRFFCEDKDGLIWIGGDFKNSLLLIDSLGDVVNRFLPSKEIAYSFGGESILFMHISKTGLLWVSTEKGGIYKANLNTTAFNIIDNNSTRSKFVTGQRISGIYEDSNKNLYVGTDAGLNIINIKSNKLTNLRGKKELFNNTSYRYSNRLPSGLISIIKETSDNKIWLGAYDNKVSLYDPATNNFLNFHKNDNDDSSFKIWSTRAICITKRGNTYFGGIGFGISQLNSDKLSFTHFPVVNTGDSSGTNDNRINTIYEDRSGLLWIGTFKGGLNMFNPKTNLFKHYVHNPNDVTSISSNFINCVYQSGKNTIWIGTMWGLNKFDIKTQIFKAFTTDNGMPNNSIHGILEDEEGYLWISTNKGIVKFDQISEEIIIFSKDDGLQDEEYNGNSYFKNSEGTMYFGGVKGITYFKPEEITQVASNPSVAFTNFKLFNKVVEANDTINNKIVLQKSISYSDEIFLDYTDKIISFEFASLHFLSQKKIKYRYKLEGFENEWNEVGYSQRFANYTNLPSGTYTLKVSGSNGSGKWGSPTEITIHISPPFWETLWFRSVMLLIIISLVVIIIHLRTKKLTNDKQKLETIIFEKTRGLSEVNTSLEETEEELLQQNNELVNYKNHLEDMVKVRTSDLKKAKLKAEESDKLKSLFLSNISHEIRTPLNAIVGFSTLVSSSNISEEESIEYASIIQNNSDTLQAIINDIVDVSVIQAGQLELTKLNFNIKKILDELIISYKQKKSEEVEIQLVVSDNEDAVEIYNDPSRFKQIMNNIIGNSIKFTKKGYIKFGYKILDSTILFFVHDSGPGIALDKQDGIFQYFNKVNLDKNKYYEGTGLGLSISKSLVEQMGGKIWFESDTNKGTKFMFELPYNSIT